MTDFMYRTIINNQELQNYIDIEVHNERFDNAKITVKVKVII